MVWSKHGYECGSYCFSGIRLSLPLRRFRGLSLRILCPRNHSEGNDIDLRLKRGESMIFGILYEITQELERRFGRKVETATNPPERMRQAFWERIQKDEVLLYVAA